MQQGMVHREAGLFVWLSELPRESRPYARLLTRRLETGRSSGGHLAPEDRFHPNRETRKALDRA